jgi:hypothetical protein
MWRLRAPAVRAAAGEEEERRFWAFVEIRTTPLTSDHDALEQ